MLQKKIVLILLATIILLLFGCTQPQTNTQNPSDTINTQDEFPQSPNNPPQNSSALENTDGIGPFYEPFSQEKFEEAKAANSIILLEFYANWCPICAAQKPEIQSAFQEISNPKIVGFQVNYRDTETEAAEENLARKYGVTYQHTHVIIDSGENQLLKEIATQWDKKTAKQKLESFA